MSAMRMFAATTGLHPFNLNRVSFILAFTVAVLVIAKLIDAYIFCGFNLNLFIDLPFGVTLFAGYCVMPLLGVAVNRRTKSKRGRCCRTFSIVFIWVWLFGGFYGSFVFVHLPGYMFAEYAGNNRHPVGYLDEQPAGIDAFNVCGNRTYRTVRAQFSNALPTFDVLQRIDLVYKIVNGVAWLLPMAFAAVAWFFFLVSLADAKQDHQTRENSEAGRSCDNGATIVRMEGEPRKFSTAAKLETIDESSDQPVTIGSDCESPVFGIVADDVSEDVKSNDSGDNDVELQFFRA